MWCSSVNWALTIASHWLHGQFEPFVPTFLFSYCSWTKQVSLSCLLLFINTVPKIYISVFLFNNSPPHLHLKFHLFCIYLFIVLDQRQIMRIFFLRNIRWIWHTTGIFQRLVSQTQRPSQDCRAALTEFRTFSLLCCCWCLTAGWSLGKTVSWKDKCD